MVMVKMMINKEKKKMIIVGEEHHNDDDGCGYQLATVRFGSVKPKLIQTKLFKKLKLEPNHKTV